MREDAEKGSPNEGDMLPSDALSLREKRNGTRLDGEMNFAMTSPRTDVFLGSESSMSLSSGSVSAHPLFEILGDT